MSVNQWTIDDFESQRPVFRVSVLARILLGLAYMPFGIGAVYWGYCVAVKPFLENPGFAMYGSVFLGGLVGVVASIVTVEWAADYHYGRLQRRYDVIARCESLLRAVLGNEDFLKAHYGHERPPLIERLKLEAESTVGRIPVDERDQPQVLALIDAWTKAASDDTQRELDIAVSQGG